MHVVSSGCWLGSLLVGLLSRRLVWLLACSLVVWLFVSLLDGGFAGPVLVFCTMPPESDYAIVVWLLSLLLAGLLGSVMANLLFSAARRINIASDPFLALPFSQYCN